MTIQYAIRAMDVSTHRLHGVCFGGPLNGEVEFTAEMIKENGAYPAGERFDELIREALKTGAFESNAHDLLKDAIREVSTLIAAPFSTTEETAASAPVFRTQGNEKIYLSRAVSAIRCLPIPIEFI
jgi:hypothetical protein